MLIDLFLEGLGEGDDLVLGHIPASWPSKCCLVTLTLMPV